MSNELSLGLNQSVTNRSMSTGGGPLAPSVKELEEIIGGKDMVVPISQKVFVYG